MSLIGIRSSNRSVVTVRASRGRPVTEADTDSSRDKRSDIPANASGRMRAGPGQTNEKVIHRNTIIIIIDARRPTWNNDRENIISTRRRTRARGEQVWKIYREPAGVSASISIFLFIFSSKRTNQPGLRWEFYVGRRRWRVCKNRRRGLELFLTVRRKEMSVFKFF